MTAPPTEEERQRLLEILRSNQGFSVPEKWTEYALRHNFRQIRSEKLQNCPECGCQRFLSLGQYIYFSTLSQLRKCPNCGLAYSDSKIDVQEVRSHFEQSYKEENYFRVWRERIVEQISSLVDRNAPIGGRVLDVGGATGYQMAMVRQKRPDLEITVCDLSVASCAAAASRYGFRTICGSLAELASVKDTFDVVVMSDVIYYEQDLPGLWRVMPKIVGRDGSLIIRVPNTLSLISLTHQVSRLFKTQETRDLSDRIPYFTPDHFFVFSRRFLTTRLRALGFNPVIAVPSQLLTADWKSGYLNSIWFHLAKAVWSLSFGRLVLTPSILYVATRPSFEQRPETSAEQLR